MNPDNPAGDTPRGDDPAGQTAADPTAAGESAVRPGRRAQGVAAIFLIAAAALLWAASRMTWAQVYAEDGLGAPRIFDVLGADWSPWLLAIALFFLAALAVQFVLHGVWLRVVAALIALGGVAVAVPAISLLSSGDNNLYAAEVIDYPARYEVVAVTTSGGAGLVTLTAAVCAVIGAFMMARSAAGGVKMSSKYASPAARRAELEQRVFAERDARIADAAAAPTEREFWDALDEGVDPTDERP
ncbi:hypothetical protein GOHSU_02_00800 [Gordonia hirsuta DSM 44140 = NBRC 16056]|uniref:TIGR02234 family membrane protein n=1 Tax=Gordonia hirsuta DSM 44140 = NBRC 16056 TaxID=1121927 RepID=L7L7B2_9ACTN|nr:TIGR02234 family membrane protein [Gordonia hirsuta]GAC55937.1 hypothetical protein GOHSU_02_00800 [Gordonia hirsuta DSM 44140 = NBRC 16056]